VYYDETSREQREGKDRRKNEEREGTDKRRAVLAKVEAVTESLGGGAAVRRETRTETAEDGRKGRMVERRGQGEKREERDDEEATTLQHCFSRFACPHTACRL
jgi:hypothetical protein